MFFATSSLTSFVLEKTEKLSFIVFITDPNAGTSLDDIKVIIVRISGVNPPKSV